MRIQHNILAMNSYRNYNNNTSALGKNLEKLSSGYKINRAGDDAAGLAISEKMRAQIQGLTAAQKNVKDGISLVKTAEGAMQEIQDMLSRMKYLATQSANGTYQDLVDREALQDEVVALKAEIDRIAQSANFNGIQLLDGTYAGSGTTETDAAADITASISDEDNGANITAEFKFDDDISDELKAAINEALANGAAFTVTATATGVSSGDTITVNFDKLLEALGDGYKITFKDSVNADATVGAGSFGIEVVATGSATAGVIASDATSIEFTITDGDGNKVGTITIGLEEIVKGTSTVTLGGAGDDEDSSVSALTYTATIKATDGASLATIAVATGDKITIGGKTYTVVGSGSGDGATTIGTDEATNVADLITRAIELYNEDEDEAFTAEFDAETGKITFTLKDTVEEAPEDEPVFSLTVDGVKFEDIKFEKLEPTDDDKGGSGKTLDLQIGDTAAGYNILKVNIADMQVKALGIEDLNIGTQPGAQAAVDDIEKAINLVSSNRGKLGALQNRLEHTQNNLSVMAENIQDAESTIRDTDVADEMMGYVKNNILVQSAQAMLAQANQVPQGVLQLLG